MRTNSDRLIDRVDSIIDELLAFSNCDNEELALRVKLACSIIQADAIHDLAKAVQCITTGTNEVMGIAESLYLIKEKFDLLELCSKPMGNADDLKGHIHD